MSLGASIMVIAALAATAVASAVMYLPTAAKEWVRRIFLVLANINPLSFGMWRSTFSARETFMAAWFLVFVLCLATLPYLLHWKP